MALSSPKVRSLETFGSTNIDVNFDPHAFSINPSLFSDPLHLTVHHWLIRRTIIRQGCSVTGQTRSEH